MKKILITMLMLWLLPVLAHANNSIEPGDVLGVSVYKNPDLTTEAEVDANGKLNFPLIGKIKVSSLSVIEAAKRFEASLKQGGYVKDPKIIVRILESKSRRISVLGYVRVPGKYSIEVGAKSVIDFISLAGGFAPNASKKVIIVKNSSTKPQKTEVDIDQMFKQGDLNVLSSNKLQMQPGDILYVPQAPVFYIYGEVNRPGSYVYEDGMIMDQALSLGGGISPRGSIKGLTVKRKTANNKVKEIDVSTDQEIKANDVIFVKESLF